MFSIVAVLDASLLIMESRCLLLTSFYFLGDQYALKMRLVDHVYDDQVIDFLTVKIILPEGARSVFAGKPTEWYREFYSTGC